ncbi:MAG: Carbon dioxide concentrating mechanism protein CcmL [candidate division BRC1 bacterium ADurb.BinA364]|nr:MAG: Carbon dioxide concentrating mechanism protein CcmL [candidate division BRC1 bacterium ADurb.BinA364]
MDIARVIGTIVATRKSPELAASKICLLQPLDENLQPSGKPIVALDASARHGSGELVYFVTSAEAGFVSPEFSMVPSDASICGIVDHLEVAREHVPVRARTNSAAKAQRRKRSAKG